MGHLDNGNGSSSGGELIEAGVATAESTSAENLARLVGLQESPSPGASPAEVSPESSEPSDLLDAEDLDDDGGKADKSGKTKTPLWANPFIKVLFVAGLAGSAFLMVALVFGAMQRTAGGGNAVDIVVSEEAEAEPVDPIEAALQRQEEQIGELKTQNALGAQQQSLAIQADQELNPAEVLALRNRQLDLVETIQENQAEQPATNATAPPLPRPTPVTTPRPVPTSVSRPVPTPRPAPVAALPPPPPLSPAIASRPVDPQERWNTLLALGSYGQGASTAEVPSVSGVAAAPSITATPAPEVASPQAIPQFSETAQLPPSEPAVPVLAEDPTASDLTYAQEAAALLGHTLKTVPSGTVAAARLATPIYWAQDLANEQQSQRTALELTEPLYADDGSVALAPGTVLVAEVNVIAGSGLLELAVTDVVTAEDGVQRTMSLPNRHFVIAGQDGNPLIASEIRDEGGVRSAEIQLGLLGALGTVGELLNRPDSATTVIGGDTSISTVENGSVNILAGLFQGAVDAVLPIEQTRVLNRIEDIDDRPGIWFHEANAEVLVFVTDEFTFQLD